MSKSIKNMKISFKLYLLSGTAMLGMLVLVMSFFISMGRVNKGTDVISTKWMPSYVMSNMMNTALSDVRLSQVSAITSDSDREIQSGLSDIEKQSATLDSYISQYAGYITVSEEQGLYTTVQSAWSTYKQMNTRVVNLAKEGKAEEAKALLNSSEVVTAYNAVTDAINKLSSFNTNGVDEAYADSSAIYTGAVVLIIVLVLAVILVELIFSVMIIKAIRTPVQELENAALKMAQGDLDVSIGYESRDELGILAKGFRALIDKLGAIINDEKQFLAKMATGDLTVDSVCEDEYIGTFHDVLISFRTIAAKMNEAMTKISQSSEQVSNSADQVSSGAQALSQGATEQASSIEELAATINEISERIKENAENANVAKTKVNTVGESMNLSNAKMQDMIQAMSDINNSSNEIGKIIKTIEDIAFQTNILALNAAVEAARAGSAGKGFAVVADEVRNLAAKSAEASKNTAALIENSTKAVHNGTEIASETAKSLVQAVDGAKEVTMLVDKISVASTNQSSAISQITLGIDQISSVIQTNSATAQESAAASEELSSQAQLMREQVGQFHLKNDSRDLAMASASIPEPEPMPVSISAPEPAPAAVSYSQPEEDYSGYDYDDMSYSMNDKY